MTEEILHTASTLKGFITKTGHELWLWKNAARLESVSIRVHGGDAEAFLVSCFDFPAMKAVAIESLERELVRLKAEFDKL